MKKSKPSIFVYMLAYLAILMRWMRNTLPGRVVTAGLLILLVSSTYNRLSAAPFFAGNTQPQLTETEKAEQKGQAEIAKKAEAQKQEVEQAKIAAQPRVVTPLVDDGQLIFRCIHMVDGIFRDDGQIVGLDQLRDAVVDLRIQMIGTSY